MKTIKYFLFLFFALLGTSPAQDIEARLLMEKKTYYLYERIYFRVSITNNSDEEVEFVLMPPQRGPWINIDLRDSTGIRLDTRDFICIDTRRSNRVVIHPHRKVVLQELDKRGYNLDDYFSDPHRKPGFLPVGKYSLTLKIRPYKGKLKRYIYFTNTVEFEVLEYTGKGKENIKKFLDIRWRAFGHNINREELLKEIEDFMPEVENPIIKIELIKQKRFILNKTMGLTESLNEKLLDELLQLPEKNWSQYNAAFEFYPYKERDQLLKRMGAMHFHNQLFMEYQNEQNKTKGYRIFIYRAKNKSNK